MEEITPEKLMIEVYKNNIERLESLNAELLEALKRYWWMETGKLSEFQD